MKVFIGKTNSIAFVMHRAVPKLRLKETPAIDRRYLLTGPPGTGKSALAEEVGLAISSGNLLGVEQLNGQSLGVETVRRWQTDGHYNFGPRAIIVDEIDAASPAALNQLRTYLDKLPAQTTFIATSNKKVEDLPEQLQSRMKVFYFEPVPAAEVKAWAIKTFKLAAEVAGSIAVGCRGNVRAAECDCLAVLEAS